MAFNSVRDWLLGRIEKLQIGSMDYAELALNPWNDTDGFGLQSLSVKVKRRLDFASGADRDVLLRDNEGTDWKHPTIAVITSGMVVDSAQMGEARFPIDQGDAEVITALSKDGIRLDSKSEGDIDHLAAGETTIIHGPGAARTYCEIKNATPDTIREVIHSGVLACRFVR